MRTTWEPSNKILLIDEHLSRVPLKELVKRHGGSKEQIRTFLKHKDRWIPYKRGKIDLPAEKIINWYKSDIPIPEIAARCGVSESPVVTILNKYQVRKPNKFKNLPYQFYERIMERQFVLQQIEMNVTKQQLAQRWNCGVDQVTTILKHHNIEIPSSSEQRSRHNRMKRGVVSTSKDVFNTLHFKQNKSLQEISGMMGISTNYLKQLIQKWGVVNRNTRISLKFRKFCNLSNIEIQSLVDNTPITHLYKQYEVSFERFRQELTARNINIPVRFASTNEKYLGDFLEQRGFKVERQNRTLIYPYELDIFLPDQSVAIEYCGLYWHSEATGKGKNYHLNKLQKCEEQGIRLITLFEDEFINNQTLVEQKILAILGTLLNEKIMARKCQVEEIPAQTKREFLNQHHIQGDDVSSVFLGLYHNKDLVAVMTFSKPSRVRSSLNTINSPKRIWELNRYAADTNKHVVGGAGKLLTHFQRNYDWDEIYSYADKRWSVGGLYKTLKFEQKQDSPPNYWYVPRGYYKREYRFNYAKFKLVEQGFNKNQTEAAIMKERGFTRVWDCGAMKFQIERKKPTKFKNLVGFY